MARAKRKTSLGIPENIEGLLAYLFGWLTGIIFYLLERKSKFVRFHAMQSLITFLALTLISFFLTLIPFVGWMLGILVDLLSFILWIVLMIKAYQGEKFKLPVVGEIAEKYA